MIAQADIERFWSCTDRSGGPAACWPWLRGMNGRRSRYGVFYVGETKQKTKWKAHRLAYEINKGSIGPGLVVRHRCDRSECCNPEHLELGTGDDNVADRVHRGRSAIGERCGSTVYTEEQVRDLRRAIGEGMSMRAAGRMLGINPNSACSIASGRIWKHVAALALCLAFASPAAAQPDHVLLARSCISERGFRVDTDDCAAIGLVVQARMARRSETFRDAIRALAPRLHGGTIDTRLWLLDIDESCHRPRGLAATWETARGEAPSRRDACLATMAEARAIVDGTRALVCEAPPTAWGSTSDLRRRRLAGYRWRPAVCAGATFANHFGTLMRPVEIDVE